MLNWQFQYSEVFWLFCLIPIFIIIFLFYQRWRNKNIRKAGKYLLIHNLVSNHSQLKSFIKFIFILLAFGFLCLSLANPRKAAETGEARKGIDVIVALDVSNSMLATDIPPARLSRAKQLIFKLINQMPEDRIGLVFFAGNAYPQMPLTFDHDAAGIYISAADPNAIPTQGTSISDALAKAELMFNSQSGRFGSVILVTDGETHDNNALLGAQELGRKGIMINTVGIGSAEGSTITDSSGNAKKDASGQTVISRLNEQILKQIASATNGIYTHLDNIDETVKNILAQYNQIGKKALGDISLFNYSSFYSWLTFPALLILLIEMFFSYRKKLIA